MAFRWVLFRKELYKKNITPRPANGCCQQGGRWQHPLGSVPARIISEKRHCPTCQRMLPAEGSLAASVGSLLDLPTDAASGGSLAASVWVCFGKNYISENFTARPANGCCQREGRWQHPLGSVSERIISKKRHCQTCQRMLPAGGSLAASVGVSFGKNYLKKNVTARPANG